MPGQKLIVRIEPHIDALPSLLDRVEGFAEAQGVSARVMHRIAVVCEELVSNIVTHGGSCQPPATYVQVSLYQDDDIFHLSIEDDGHPFDPLGQPAPDTALELDARMPGGLGIHFARNLVKRISYARVGERNCVTASFQATD